MKFKIIFLFQIIIATNFIIAQNVDFKKKNFEDKKKFSKAYNELLEGQGYYDQKVYHLALPHLLQANNFNPNNAELNYMIGDSYLNAVYSWRSLAYLKKAYQLNPTYSLDILYKLGQAYQHNYLFDSAKATYEQFKISLSPETLYDWNELIKKRIEECESGKKLMENKTEGLVVNLKAINSKYPEYAPVLTADGETMYFTSRRPNTTGGEQDLEDFQYFEDIYVSHYDSGKWSAPQNIGAPINTNFHDATVGLSPDGQQMYIYRGNINGGDIFVSNLDGEKWGTPVDLPQPVNTEYHENSASISFDYKTLFFISDRPGGLGGRDIYYATKQNDGTWGNVKNIGAPINTKYDEDAVFIHPDGKTLYFSSKGHNTMGGYDIFKSVLQDDSTWSEPENMGYPINSPDDDVFFIVTADGHKGYYNSVREKGVGDRDLYVIVFADSLKKEKKDLVLIKGTVKSKDGQPIASSIEIYDNDKNKNIGNFKSNKATGEYLISLPFGKNYAMFVKADNRLFKTINFDLKDSIDYQKFQRDIILDTIMVNAKTVLNNIYFDYGKYTLRKESYGTLNRVVDFMKEYPAIKVEISGHTDNVSSIRTNQPLSENRAKAVYTYLIKHGIEASRLTSAGYADKYPVVPNDTREHRQMNRRVEFKIIAK